MSQLGGKSDAPVVLPGRGDHDAPEAQGAPEFFDHLKPLQADPGGRHQQEGGILEHGTLGVVKPPSFHACHGMGAHEAVTVFLRMGKQLTADGLLDTPAIHNDATGLEPVAVVLDPPDDVLGVQRHQDHIADADPLFGQLQVDRIQESGLVGRAHVDVVAHHRVGRFSLDGLCDGASDEAQAYNTDVHDDSSFISRDY